MKADSSSLSTVATTGSYTDLVNPPTIPTKTSQLQNNSNFVVDASYVHTDNNFTTTLKGKLDGIASGAEVNVQSNWNATSGDAYIQNKPNVSQRTVITTTTKNGVTIRVVEYYNFYHVTVSGDCTAATSGYVDIVSLSKGDSSHNIGSLLMTGWSSNRIGGAVQWNVGYLKVKFDNAGYKGGFLVIPKSTLG